MITAAASLERGQVPLTQTGIPIRNVWYMLLYSWGEFSSKERWQAEVERSPTLDALLAVILAGLVEQRLRIGLGRDYITADRSLRGVRGRVDFSESLRRQSFDRGEAFCRYQEFASNCPKNQIIRSTLYRLSQLGKFGPGQGDAEAIRHKMRLLVRKLEDIDLIELTPSFIRRQQLHRNDGDYRIMLAIAQLVLQRQMPTELPGNRNLPHLDRDLLTLSTVFERFVANFYRANLQKWLVSTQKKLDWFAAPTSARLPGMQADIILEHRKTGQVVILDTKFTAKTLVTGRWGKAVFDSSHIYQMYAYLRSQEHLTAHCRVATGILLYPAVHSSLSDGVQVQGHMIRFETINLALDWPEIEESLLHIPRVQLNSADDANRQNRNQEELAAAKPEGRAATALIEG